MDLKGKRIAFLVAPTFQDEEGLEPKKYLESLGAQVEYVGLDKGECAGKYGRQKVQVHKTIDEAKPAEYDAVVVPGGGAPELLRVDERVIKFVQLVWETGRPLAAICRGPQVLISAGLLKGRKVTCYQGIRDDVKLAGADYRDAVVVSDGQLITSRKPQDLPEFNEAIATAILRSEKNRLSEITDQTSALEALTIAVSREKGAHDFYTGIASWLVEESLRNKFRYLATIKREHQEELTKLYRQVSGGKEPVLKEKESELGRYSVRPGMTSAEAIRLAMAAEEKAYEFYKQAAARTRNSKGKEMFLYLAGEELEHKRLLSVDYSVTPGGAAHFQMATYWDIPPGMEDLW